MTFGDFVSEQRANLPIHVTPEACGGKTYIVTGSNTGLGLEAAKHLVRCKAKKVIIAVRNLEAGEAVKAEIENVTKIRGVAEVWHVDLADFQSVKDFAKKATESLDRIDGLIENASIALDRISIAEGYETTITINVLSTFLMAVLLLPKLSDTAKQFGTTSHLSIVVSAAGFAFKEPFDKVKDDFLRKMNSPTNANMGSRYPVSKLIQIFAGRHFAKLVPIERTGVAVNFVNPGLCKTGLSRHGRFLNRLPIVGMGLVLGRTPEMGSRTLLHGAVAGKESHGCYLSVCEIREHQLPSWVSDEEGQKQGKIIWDEIANVLEKIEPGCLSKIL
ncbi:putative short-chain dehydrogenase/reductase family protein [Daldinia caldariorum]|uniref:putative short-chain dehydrogenase/reductase family protein n=1 Tax=Daldinia caldariorum TaxID=326644 RepID=UPI0020086B72|nr:putative short-chain dehydrogenase/reductase family protein [Daldinia caldariorum]KAI1469245.1 putative short-chain dehydrogenase/reductase family protein [Daldinia caldariorum]